MYPSWVENVVCIALHSKGISIPCVGDGYVHWSTIMNWCVGDGSVHSRTIMSWKLWMSCIVWYGPDVNRSSSSSWELTIGECIICTCTQSPTPQNTPTKEINNGSLHAFDHNKGYRYYGMNFYLNVMDLGSSLSPCGNQGEHSN